MKARKLTGRQSKEGEPDEPRGGRAAAGARAPQQGAAMVSLPLPLLLLLLLLALGRPVVPSGPATSAGSSPPPTAGSVDAATPVLVAATQTSILWYPLNSATLHGADGASAILMRAQSCPDVNTNTTDSAFVSYSNGSAWSELGSQPVQERLCYPYPLSSRSSVMCLPSVDAGLDQASSSPGSATFLGTLWQLRGGNLAKDPNRTAVAVKFDYRAAPPLPAGSFMTMFMDGVSVPDASGKGVLMPVMAAAQPRPPAGLTAACRAEVVRLCPGVQVHGAQCFACVHAHAAELHAASCPAVTSNASNYAYYCDPGKPLPDMIFESSDGLSFTYRSSVRSPSSAIHAALETGSENALLRLSDGRLMMVMRYDYADYIPSHDPMPAKGGGPAVSVGGLIQVFSHDDGRTCETHPCTRLLLLLLLIVTRVVTSLP